MLITEQSLVERLDGRARDPRRRCRLFIPHQAVFIPNQLLFSPRLVCSHPADRWPGEAGHGGMEVPANCVATGGLADGVTDRADVEDDEDDESVAEDARLGRGAGVAVHDGGVVVGPASRRRKPQL